MELKRKVSLATQLARFTVLTNPPSLLTTLADFVHLSLNLFYFRLIAPLNKWKNRSSFTITKNHNIGSRRGLVGSVLAY